MKIAKNIWLRFKKWVTKFKFVKSLENGIKNHKAQFDTIGKLVICMFITIFVKEIGIRVINTFGFSDSWITLIKKVLQEVLNLLLMELIWLALYNVFNVHNAHPLSAIKKKCPSIMRIVGLELLVPMEVVASMKEGLELARIGVIITFIIVFAQLRRDKKGKNDKDNKYNEVTEYLKYFGLPAIEIIVFLLVRFAEITVRILTICGVDLVLKLNQISPFLLILTISLYVKIGIQLFLNLLYYGYNISPGLQQSITLGFYIISDFIAFLYSMPVIDKELKSLNKCKPNIHEIGYFVAINLFFSFCLVLITWFCYFSYCGFFLKRDGKSLDYEFWTLLFKSIVKACIAFAVIENGLPRNVGLGISFTIWLSVINSLVTTLYPMIDIYKFVRKGLETTPVKSIKF